jgi:hypothetical protein
MQRFRLLRFYVVGVVAAISLAVLGVSRKRTAADAATPPLSAAGPRAPSAANTEPSQSGSPTTEALLRAKASTPGGNAEASLAEAPAFEWLLPCLLEAGVMASRFN